MVFCHIKAFRVALTYGQPMGSEEFLKRLPAGACPQQILATGSQLSLRSPSLCGFLLPGDGSGVTGQGEEWTSAVHHPEGPLGTQQILNDFR